MLGEIDSQPFRVASFQPVARVDGGAGQPVPGLLFRIGVVDDLSPRIGQPGTKAAARAAKTFAAQAISAITVRNLI